MIDQNDPRLTAYVLGELSSAEMAEIEAAIHESPELAAAVEEIAGMTGLLGEAYGSEEKLSLSTEQKKTLAAKPVKSRSDEGWRWLAVAVAACLAVVLFGGKYFQDYFQNDRRHRVAQTDAIEAPISTEGITYKIETRTRKVPVTRVVPETKSRVVQMQRMRREIEEVDLEDGTKGKKIVETPYTEQVTQSYTVNVPVVEEVTRTFEFKVPYDANGNQIAEADFARYGIDPDELIVRPEVVFQLETRTGRVPVMKMRTETRTRTVPVTRYRKEQREVTLDDGSKVTKEIDVPYIENVAQNYQVSVPYTSMVGQTFAVKVPYTVDGEEISAADYSWYGIDPQEVAELAQRDGIVLGGEDAMGATIASSDFAGEFSVAASESGIVSPDADEWQTKKTARSKYTDVRIRDSESAPNTGGVDLRGGTEQISGLDLAAAPVVPPASVPPMRGQSILSDMEVDAFGEPGVVMDLATVEDELRREVRRNFAKVENLTTESFEIQGRLPNETDSQGLLIEALASHDRQPGLLGGGGVFGPLFRNPDLGTSRLSGESAPSDGQEPMEADFFAGDDGYLEIAGLGESRIDEIDGEEETEPLLRGEESTLASAEQESNPFGNKHPEVRGAQRAVRQIEKARKKSSEQLQVLEREKVAQAQQLASLESQNGKISRQLEERKKKLAQIRGKVGTGHPDYEAALAQVELIEKQLEESESTKMRFERVRDSLKQVLVSFKKVDELKKSGSTDDRKEALKMLEARLVEMESAATFLEQRLGNGHEAFKSIRTQIEGLKGNFKAERIALQKAITAKPKSWKRVKAIPNTTRLMVGDKEELSLNGMQVNAQVDGFRARVLVDYFYYNDRERQLEGNFKLRLPDDASLYYFAFGESAYEFSGEGKLATEEFHRDGRQFVSLGAQDVKRARKNQWDNVKEARVVPKEKAAHAFRETVRRRIDPALVEWSGAGVFNAKVFPLSPKKLHRIVVGYDVNLKRTADGQKFELTLPEQTGQCRVEVNVQEIEGVSYSAKPEVDPIPTEAEGKLQKRFVFDNDESPLSSVEVSVKADSEPMLQSSAEEGGFWTVQVKPDLPVENAKANSRAIFMVDTSLSSSPDKFNVWLKMLEATLENNRDSLKEFDVLFFNVDGHFWKGKYVANTAENVAELKTTLQNLALEGATDLYGAVQAITEAEWVGRDGVSPDLFLLSDGAATWGETDLRLIDQLLQKPELGSLFAYQTGLTGTSISGLRFLVGQSGGAVFSVATEDEVQTASTAHRKRPWELKAITATGGSDVLTAGRVQWVYPGQTITLVGRGNVEKNIELDLQQGSETKKVTFAPTPIPSDLASRMYGHVAVEQLESLGQQVFDVSAAYARHFRITGQTCSLLMLESEEDYKRFDIKPQEDLFVVKAKAASKLVNESLAKNSESLSDPKARLQAWLLRLESMPGMKFKMPTALKLAMDDIKVEAVSQPMNCSLTKKEGLSGGYASGLNNEQLDYGRISAEARRRLTSSADDAIKVYSSLIERNPGDIIVARDIAFTAMDLERPAAAFHLLRRVAQARPFQGNIYPAIGQCLAQLGKADMAIVYYEIAMNGTFQRQGGEFKQIVAAEYMHLLRKVVSGELESSVKDYAAARLETLGKHLPFGTADVVVTMMWNQDQTDVDLHIFEPSGEECSYQHKRTKSGGQITTDITTGFGPEMYFNANAPRGKYKLKAKYFSSGQNRTSTRNKVYMTIIRNFGTDEESMTRRTVQLKTVGEVEPIMTFGVE